MDGPRRRPEPEVVHRIHDRYLVEVVERLNLCPFARRSRELGRVHRPLFYVEDLDRPSPAECAEQLATLVTAHADAEIVLLTFVDLADRFVTPEQLDPFVSALRECYGATGARPFFMVGFHPGLGEDDDPARRMTKDRLVPLIRRSPDPVIQCVDADVLQRVRAQAQQRAHERLIETLGRRDPVLRKMLENSIQADSQLSADIAQHNFEGVGSGAGRDVLEERIASIRAERDSSYGWSHGRSYRP